MLNLLPKDQKNKITREYKTRFWITALALTFVAEIISLVLFVPSYLTAEIRAELLNEQSAGVKVQSVNTETASLEDIIRQTNSYLAIFTSSTTPTGVANAIQNIISVRGSDVVMNGFNYSLQNGQQQIVVNGTASSRQALQDFADKLKDQPGVASADLPVSDFAQAQNIDFSINVLMKPQP